MNYILFDDSTWKTFLPLTFTRPVADIRIGILTITEKWNKYLNTNCSYLTQDYLSEKYLTKITSDNILINGSVLPNTELIGELNNLQLNEALVKDNNIIAVRLDANGVANFNITSIDLFQQKTAKADFLKLSSLCDIFSKNGEVLIADYKLITKGRTSQILSKTNNILGLENIFVEEGAKAEFVTLNASTGPIYIGKDAELMEGSIVRGPFSIGEHSTLKLAAKIYGPTTIGPHCKVGGEINNSIIFGYTNKAHDGFLGNSVLGEWCNIGADSNNSNLKNSYEEVKLWSYEKEHFLKTGHQFCGLFMGDHSKCAINTMFNTGTIVGVSANIFGAGFPRNFIPSFSWGGPQGVEDYSLSKAIKTAEIVYNRRNIPLSDIDKKILSKIYEMSQSDRK